MIVFNNIPGSIRKPGAYVEINTRLAVSGLPANKQKMLIVAQLLAALIEPARWQGGTLNDATSGGDYSGAVKKNFIIQISTAAATDKFKWSTDGGANWSAETDVTGAAQALEDGVTVTIAATTGHAVGDEWRFGAWAAPSAAALEAKTLFSDAEAADYFGYGSIAHLMASCALGANAYLDLTAIALDDAATAVKSAGSITLTGPAAGPGAVSLHIGRITVQAGVATGDTGEEIAIALQNELAKKPALPVTVAVDDTTAGKINFEARHGGALGDQIPIGYEITAAGVGASVVAMTGGSVDPDIDDALSAVYAERYHLVASAYNDATSLGKLATHLDSVSGPMEQRPGRGVFATTGALADATTLSGQLNAARLVPKYLRYTSASKRQAIAYEIAAAYAAVDAFVEDPARPLNARRLLGIPAPAIDDRLSRTEQESCLWNGVSPLEVNASGKVAVVRAISSYTQNDQGIDDPALLDTTTIKTLDYVRKAVRDRIALRFPDSKLNARVIESARDQLEDVLKRLEAAEIIEEVDAHKDALIVERNENDPNRVDASIPSDVVNGLHVFAGRIDLIL